ncbi:MAG TPA: alanine racemase [Blastocatellia bacterium]|nr:alanine racemase [Blastocatellia bacterium]
MTTPARSTHILEAIRPEDYLIENASEVLTPALAIYTEILDQNIAVTLDLVGSADRWRPHVKTAKLSYVMRRLVDRGVMNFKCSTTLELRVACEAGAADVVLAYPAVGANARRARALADEFPSVKVSALVENSEQIEGWSESRVGLFIDINPGMDRTGIEQDRADEIAHLARAIEDAGIAFRGLHYYDGHLAKLDLAERERVAHAGYDRLIDIARAVEGIGIKVPEVITAGTPAMPCSLSYPRLAAGAFIHRLSPGTIVYSDCTSLSQLPKEWGYRPAAVVVSTVVSQPAKGRITCDAGHKTVSADSGVPTCAVIGRPELLPARPSEEHLPVEILEDQDGPKIGEQLYLVPMHICPTVNNFDYAMIVEGNRVAAVECVTARGREAPL